MGRTQNALISFKNDRHAASSLEYALMLATIGIAVILAGGYMGFHLWDLMTNMANALTGVSDLWATY